MVQLNEDNFLLFAARHYNNDQCLVVDEFLEDINRIRYIRRLIVKYVNSNKSTDTLNVRLILNHIVAMYNVFDAAELTEMLLFKLEGYEEQLLPFLFYLGYINSSEVVFDNNIVIRLREI